ncbi:predicted protein [Uncinocarpus reesii 1704]|uniref:Uncharacterized protein n=1 Tax=Uncinocarpus reesii (strain UAMH 1704) TaxID=336963 RepID=C4JDD7_UNCRE|nr:uncharacterized protein UREG_00303 [Uncinocarpus reesii 1704]EEP75457.1 predicted protein [Uncinocarpus reesii 1704]
MERVDRVVGIMIWTDDASEVSGRAKHAMDDWRTDATREQTSVEEAEPTNCQWSLVGEKRAVTNLRVIERPSGTRMQMSEQRIGCWMKMGLYFKRTDKKKKKKRKNQEPGGTSRHMKMKKKKKKKKNMKLFAWRPSRGPTASTLLKAGVLVDQVDAAGILCLLAGPQGVPSGVNLHLASRLLPKPGPCHPVTLAASWGVRSDVVLEQRQDAVVGPQARARRVAALVRREIVVQSRQRARGSASTEITRRFVHFES